MRAATAGAPSGPSWRKALTAWVRALWLGSSMSLATWAAAAGPMAASALAAGVEMVGSRQ